MKRLLGSALVAMLPWRLRRRVLTRFFGYDIHPTAWIGVSLLNCERVRLGANARIGHLNVITRLEKLDLAEGATIANLNYIYGVKREPRVLVGFESRESALVLGLQSALTSRHLVDCTDRVTLGEFSTVAGYRTTLLTHSVDFESNRQSCGPIDVGSYSFVGTNCVLLMDARVPARSLVAAGSVVTSAELAEDSIIGGVPSRVIGPVPASWLHFRRSIGRVS